MLAPYVVEALGEPLHIVLELADRGLRPSHVAYDCPLLNVHLVVLKPTQARSMVGPLLGGDDHRTSGTLLNPYLVTVGAERGWSNSLTTFRSHSWPDKRML